MRRVRAFSPIALLFIVLNGFFIAGRSMLQRWEADQNVLIFGNLLLFAITFFSFLIAARGLANPNPHAFVRAVYGGIMLKLFVCIIAALIYISSAGKDVNRPSLFMWMGLYLLYTFIEVSILTRLLRENKNV